MILSDRRIKQLLAAGELSLEPLTPEQIQPASIDLRLGTSFLQVDEKAIELLDLETPPPYLAMEQDHLILQPHCFILATTMEYIKLPDNLTAFVEGRSSIGRMGLFIQNAGWVDPGFEGEITLELYNATSLPLRLDAGRRICQLVLAQMDQPAQNPYKGKYQGQRKATGSQVYRDKEAGYQGN